MSSKVFDCMFWLVTLLVSLTGAESVGPAALVMGAVTGALAATVLACAAGEDPPTTHRTVVELDRVEPVVHAMRVLHRDVARAERRMAVCGDMEALRQMHVRRVALATLRKREEELKLLLGA